MQASKYIFEGPERAIARSNRESSKLVILPKTDTALYKSLAMPNLQNLVNKVMKLDALLNLPPGIFKFGQGFAAINNGNEHIKWIAEKTGNCTWSIKAAPEKETFDFVYDHGSVLKAESVIKHFVDCDWEAYEMYNNK